MINETDLSAEQFDNLDEDTIPVSVNPDENFPPQDEIRPSIFISYKHNEINNSIAVRVKKDLDKEYDVFVDQYIAVGEQYVKNIEDRLKTADFVIALISADAIESDWVYQEIKTARELYDQTGKPVILPVRVEFSAPYGFRLNTCLERFQYYYWKDSNDFSSLLQMLKGALNGQPVELTDEAIAGLESYLINQFTASYFADSYADIPEFERTVVALESQNLMWITGDTGVRNYTVLSLAVKKGVSKIYEIPRSLDWTRIVNSGVKDSILILRDVLPSHFEEESIGSELAALNSLTSRKNLVFMTSSEDEFSEAKQQLRRFDFNDFYHKRIDYEFYNPETKHFIFRKLLETSSRFDRINARQFRLGLSLLEESNVKSPQKNDKAVKPKIETETRNRFQQVIRKWSPDDIERFVIYSLPEVEKPSDIAKILQHNATLDNEIHFWFLSLDDSVKCFLLTLAIFSELDNWQIWTKHKQIFHKLKQLDAKLSLWPLGICRQRAAPYVSSDGAIGFIDERIAGVIRLEIVKSYREYFIELIPEMKQWSIPILAEETAVYPTEEKDRALVARMVGEALKLDHNDLLSLIESWADHGNWRIREGFAIAVERTVTDVSGANRIFELIRDWCFNSSDLDARPHRVWAAVSALGRIACVAPESPISKEALQYLTRLTNDSRNRVTDFLSLAVKKMAKRLPLSEISTLLFQLAHNKGVFTKINTADALNEARSLQEVAGYRLYNKWISSEDKDLRWIAICSLIIQGEQRKWEKSSEKTIEEIIRFMNQDPIIFADALQQTIYDEHYRKNALTTLYKLAQKSEYGSNNTLVVILAYCFSKPSDESIFTLLRSSERPRLAHLVAEVKSKIWKDLLSTPVEFLLTIDAVLRQANLLAETHNTLGLLIRPEPVGNQRQFIEAMAVCLRQEHEKTEEVLLRLKTAVPALFGAVALEVRRETLNLLLPEPGAFTEFVYLDIRHPERAGEVFDVLESFAQSEPIGKQDTLVEAFIRGYALHPNEVDTLIAMFRTSNRPALSEIVRRVKPKLLESLLPNPVEFLNQLLNARNNPQEWAETLNVLQYLASSGSRRSDLINALAGAMVQRQDQVRTLLNDDSLRSKDYLGLWFRMQITIAFYVKRLFG